MWREWASQAPASGQQRTQASSTTPTRFGGGGESDLRAAKSLPGGFPHSFCLVSPRPASSKPFKESPRPLDDDELAHALGVVRQQINQAARRLEASEKLLRVKGPNRKLVNVIAHRKGRRLAATMARAAPAIREGTDHLTEDEVKKAVQDHLVAQEYRVEGVGPEHPGSTSRPLRRVSGWLSKPMASRLRAAPL